MKKYFVTSDIHSYFDEWMRVLNDAGFDINNPDHILIIDGDLFDHGNQSKMCFEYAQLLNKLDRLIYIKGNHEHLMINFLNLEYPVHRCYTTELIKTWCELTGDNYEEWKLRENKDTPENKQLWKELIENVKKTGVIEFIKENTIDFYELGEYIITHSFIPIMIKDKSKNYELDEIKKLGINDIEYNPDWRNEKDELIWHAVGWFDPWEKYEWGLFNVEEAKGKKLIAGHWGNPDLYKRHVKIDDQIHSEILYYRNLINIDGKVVDSGKLNCYVIEK